MPEIKILLVDDHIMFLDSLKASLETIKEFSIVGIAFDGIEAIERSNEIKPDIVLMDITMPKLDGIKAAREIKRNNPITKIILLTMHASNKEYIDVSRSINIEGYVLKTASLQELESCIHTVNSGQKYYDKSIPEFVRSSPESNYESIKLLSITLREREVINLIAEGYSSKEIAKKLNISTSTVNNHKNNIFRKLDINSAAELIKFAMDKNLLL